MIVDEDLWGVRNRLILAQFGNWDEPEFDSGGSGDDHIQHVITLCDRYYGRYQELVLSP